MLVIECFYFFGLVDWGTATNRISLEKNEAFLTLILFERLRSMSLNAARPPHALSGHTHWHTFYSFTQQQTHTRTHTLTEMLNPISLSSRVRRAENPINVTVWITAAQSTGSRRVENQWICQPLKRRRREKNPHCFSASSRRHRSTGSNSAPV